MIGCIVVFACNLPAASTPTPDLLATLSAATPLPVDSPTQAQFTNEPTGKIVVVFRYSDREPLAFACDPAIAEELGKGLLALAADASLRRH